MARLFYDSLSNDYLVLNAAYTYGHDNNIYSLNDSDKGSFNQNSDYYGKQEGNYDTKTFTAFYNSKSFYSNAFVVNAGVNETLYKENSKISRADTRHYYGGVEFKHFRDENKGALRFGVNTYTTFVKRSPEGGFSYESMLTTFTPLTDFWTKYGAISIGAPFKIDYNQNTNGQSREYGGSLGLIPWGINRYLSPSANMNITYLEGGGLSSDANKYLFSLANLAQMGDFFSLYANASYFLNDAQGLSDRYEVTSGNITAIWSLRTILTGLMFRLAWDESLVRTGEHYSNHTHRRLLSSTLNFTF